MEFSDFIFINQQAILGWFFSFFILGVVYLLLVHWFEGEARKWFQVIMAIFAFIMLISMTMSFLNSVQIHTERTIIDRTVSDESFDELKKSNGQPKQGEIN